MDMFCSRGLYGRRQWNHFAAYSYRPGWVFVEAGPWTLEIGYEPGRLHGVLAKALPFLRSDDDGNKDLREAPGGVAPGHPPT